jgi:hypothetical protein
MKKILLSTLMLMAFGTMFTSCSSGDYDMTPSVDKSGIPKPLKPVGNHAGGALLTANINGAYWSSRPGYMDIVAGQPVIYGSWTPGDITSTQQITLSFNNYHGVGSYYFNADGNATWLIDSITTASTYGFVAVDSDGSGIIKGRFNFQGQDLVVTNGLFKVIKN